MNFETEIKLLISSNNTIIYIMTEEEDRLEYTIYQISQKIFQKKINTWDFIDGYKNNPNYKENAKKNPLQALEIIEKDLSQTPEIFFLKDFHFFINDLSIIRKIKNLSKLIKINNKYIIISGTELEIPTTLKEYIHKVKFPLPNKKEIQIELIRLFKILKITNELSLENLSIAYKGFSISRIRKSITRIIINKELNNKIFDIILKEKKRFIEQTDILNFHSNTEKLEEIGGLNNLKKWLKMRSYTFSKKAQQYGIPKPRGILLTGIQGTGKSLCAKTISKQWNLPLLKLDVSKIFASILGESEKKIQQMINICEQVSPCILWIDEIDKIFTKYNNNNDSGTTNRVTNIFLTWLSEKNSYIFIVATANNINNLPLEIIRKGRFDEIFFLNLPNFEERLNIFQIHLKNLRPLTWKKYNIHYLSKITIKFSGSEIKQAIIEAMYNAFYENREFKTKDIVDAIKLMIPIAFTDEIAISNLQLWYKSGKIRLA
uniref:Uncharacterized AAA domain-containing protein ycf46 n=1 Tax=Acrosorium ciliolatum TaxID=1550622 RepID=A0A1Z1M1H9_9FLOR|nr:hypothetical protein [Acrosorium ciliolatum]ARW59896.1 hypothetical protein [Acrosorium ciliolatum]